jgi:hypothetical protein
MRDLLRRRAQLDCHAACVRVCVCVCVCARARARACVRLCACASCTVHVFWSVCRAVCVWRSAEVGEWQTHSPTVCVRHPQNPTHMSLPTTWWLSFTHKSPGPLQPCYPGQARSMPTSEHVEDTCTILSNRDPLEAQDMNLKTNMRLAVAQARRRSTRSHAFLASEMLMPDSPTKTCPTLLCLVSRRIKSIQG